jgi:type II secretory ATPase GspE/PulE/Tfp pilus assembly ATPase PilB-like protein
MAAKKLGEILLENRMVSEGQLQEALELQKVFPNQTVGQLLCKLGFLKESDLVYILEQTGKRQRLSDILLKEKLIESDQLVKAMELSRKEDITLAKAVLRLRYVDEAQLAKVIAGQYDLSFVHIDTLVLDPELARHINASYAQKQRIVPISKIGNTLTLAMAYPLKFQDLKELESSIRLKLIPVVAPEGEILLAQQKLYKMAAPAVEQYAEDLSEIEISPDSIGEILSTAMVDEPDVEEETRKVTEKDSIIVKLVNKIIYDAYMNKASDIHIEPYPGKSDVMVRIRVDGHCKLYQRIPYKYKFAIPSRIKIMSELDISERRRPQDGKINFKKFAPLDIELRIATMPTAGGLEDVVIRILNTGEPMPFERLGLSPGNMKSFVECINHPYGLILVVGPTGSGKTTTLHSAVGKINRPEVKIWTAEDPVEITQKGLRQVQINHRIGLTFANTLRSFLRLDPDVILVGEMRDVETSAIAIEASLTGHLVLSTLHTNTAPDTITRLLEMGLDPFSFSDSLLCILAQRLARTLCPDCKEEYRPSDEELESLIEEYGAEQFRSVDISAESIRLARPVGCGKCGNSGYRGRLGIHELLVATDAIRTTIRKKMETDVVRRQAMADGMTTLRQDGILKVLQGLTDIHEIRRVCVK